MNGVDDDESKLRANSRHLLSIPPRGICYARQCHMSVLAPVCRLSTLTNAYRLPFATGDYRSRNGQDGRQANKTFHNLRDGFALVSEAFV